MFRREALLSSEWYQDRLRVKQRADAALWRRHVETLEAARASMDPLEAQRLELDARLAEARAELSRVKSPEYLGSLVGTLGADPMAH